MVGLCKQYTFDDTGECERERFVTSMCGDNRREFSFNISHILYALVF
jgi:hypothetical protein